MRYHLHIISFAIALYTTVLTVSSCHNPYKELDYAIAHSDEFDNVYYHRQDSLRCLFENAPNDSLRFEYAFALQKNYFYHNADSCHRYARKMLELSKGSPAFNSLSRACLCRILIRLDSLDKAETIFCNLSPELIRDDEKYIYYFTKYTLQRRKDRSDTVNINKILLEWRQKDSLHADCFYITNHDKNALERIIADPISPNEYAKANYGLGMIYISSGQKDKAIKYLIESAKTDMEISVKGYGALYELARIIMRNGDVKRAVRYTRRTRQDAEYYNYASKIRIINGIEVETLNMLLAQERREKRFFFIITPIIVMLLLLTVMFMLRHKRAKKKLEEMSSIKDEFLTTYMERCVDYLNKVDVYRSDLRHTAKKDGPDAVLAILRKPSFADSEFHKLLHDFDTAFLGIFPDFVDKINSITKEEYYYKLTEDGSLTTNLRILALIRLGITERKKIAKILNMSVGTVYAYHTHLQQHSICTPAEFDKVVKKL